MNTIIIVIVIILIVIIVIPIIRKYMKTDIFTSSDNENLQNITSNITSKIDECNKSFNSFIEIFKK